MPPAPARCATDLWVYLRTDEEAATARAPAARRGAAPDPALLPVPGLLVAICACAQAELVLPHK